MSGREIPRRLLVVRLGAMGDVIHTMSAVASLRVAFPEIEIGWVIEERWAELLSTKGHPLSGPRTPACPLVDSLHLVNTKKWRRNAFSMETRAEMRNAIREIRLQHYDVAADFQGAIKSAMLARLAGATNVIGMAQPREAPARLLYKEHIATRGNHVIEHYHSLAEGIVGQTFPTVPPEFPCEPAAKASLSAKLGNRSEGIVVLNPGAGWAAKQWPAEKYGEVAKALARDGLRPVINFGPGEEELARAAEAASAGTASKLSCSIAELIALTRRARLFIGGDTGPLHLAAALRVPVVAIFGPTDPARNGPFGTRNIVLRHPASRTSLSHTSTPDPGLLQITTEEVVKAAKQLLGESNG